MADILLSVYRYTMTPWFDAIFNSLLGPNCVIALEARAACCGKANFILPSVDGMQLQQTRVLNRITAVNFILNALMQTSVYVHV